MSYDEQDAAYDRFIDELHKDFREQALDDAELYDKVVDSQSQHRRAGLPICSCSVAARRR